MTSCGISKLFKHVKCLNHIQDVWNTKHEPYFSPIWHEYLFDCNADASLLILLKGKHFILTVKLISIVQMELNRSVQKALEVGIFLGLFAPKMWLEQLCPD